MPAELIGRLKKIRAFVFDFDGVFTDGNLLLLEDGEWLRKINVKDVYAVKNAVTNRYRICIIADKGSEAIAAAFEEMGIKELTFDPVNRVSVVEKFIIDNELDITEVMYMGDDIPDLAAMKIAGLAVCPQDAAAEAKEAAHYITEAPGGKGCVREIIEMVMKVHDQWKI